MPAPAAKPMFPATLFDFNGVLVDDESVHLAAFRDALAPLGIGLTDEAYVEKYLGYDDRGAFDWPAGFRISDHTGQLAGLGLGGGDRR